MLATTQQSQEPIKQPFSGSAQESEKLVDLLDSRVAVWRYARRDERQ